MATVLKFSKSVTLALHTMVILAENPDSLVPARLIAERHNVSEAHLSKVLQRLSKQGLVKSVRGPGGGFQLAGDPEKITLLDCYEAIEGPLIDERCLLHQKACSRKKCILGGLLESMNGQIRGYLTDTSLADLIEDRSD